MALSMLVTLNGTTMSGARVPFAVARDGYFFPSRRASASSVPDSVDCDSAAIGLAVTLLLVGQNFRQLFTLAIFAEWLFYMITASTVFVFRRREPDAVRPYRVWGYPVVPALFVLASARIALLHLHRQSAELGLGMPGDSGRCTGFLLFSPAAFRLIRRKAAPGARFGTRFHPDFQLITKVHRRQTRLPLVPFPLS